MGIQVAIRVPDEENETGYRKVHGPTQPKGAGHSKDPYLGFPDHRHPWRGSLTDGLAALQRWLGTKPALARRAATIQVYHIRSPHDVRGKRARERAEAYLEEG